ncbi:alpha-(1,3)-fucosyltransferase C-like [Mya arenaria]|uniref:alpha-(1,3)-fucosyltransferase C-like n=1 Tax=Mya arenaria TaxID=6604 RepID=UPI0022DFE56E|nr:alpha-(1,3)-fucosyltransferase C-like [Mya arenaria]
MVLSGLVWVLLTVTAVAMNDGAVQSSLAEGKMRLTVPMTSGMDETIGDALETEENSISPYINRNLYVNTSMDIRTHKILLWNPPGWLKNWWGDTDMNQCSYRNCKIVYDRRDIADSSAVVFSIADGDMSAAPPVSPNKRNPDQAWIFFTLESPVHVVRKEFRSHNWHNAFNWSWTYRTDADIFHPYGILKTRTKLLSKNYTEIFRKKSKMTAWAVSHCKTFSERENFLRLLVKQGIPIDVYGKCGTERADDLNVVLDKDYKFYFGFENSFCPDYVTEKFFQYYKRDLITVVRGASNYGKYLPQGSYINTADFKSVKELAVFMKRLSLNEEEYISYLKKKDRYEVFEREYTYRDAVCNICHKLNNLDKYRKSYGNIEEWLGKCFAVNDLR